MVGCGGLVVSVPATRHTGSNLGVSGAADRSVNTVQIKYKTRPWLAVSNFTFAAILSF